jgi:hypothetical protein
MHETSEDATPPSGMHCQGCTEVNPFRGIDTVSAPFYFRDGLPPFSLTARPANAAALEPLHTPPFFFSAVRIALAVNNLLSSLFTSLKETTTNAAAEVSLSS